MNGNLIRIFFLIFTNLFSFGYSFGEEKAFLLNIFDKDEMLAAHEVTPVFEFQDKFLDMLYLLALLLGGMIAILWIIKKISQPQSSSLFKNSLIKVIDSKALSAKSTLYLIEIEGKRLVLVESIGNVSLSESH